MDMATTTHQEHTMIINTTITLEKISGLEIVNCNGYYAIVNRALGNVEYVKDLKTAEAVLVSVAKDRLASWKEQIAA
jgi:hypothetical protein